LEGDRTPDRPCPASPERTSQKRRERKPGWCDMRWGVVHEPYILLKRNEISGFWGRFPSVAVPCFRDTGKRPRRFDVFEESR